MPPDDGRITETCCGSNIAGGEEALLNEHRLVYENAAECAEVACVHSSTRRVQNVR
jgi:hypothetical protein